MKTTGDATEVQDHAILELLRKRVTVLGAFALSQLRVSSLHPIEPLVDTLRFQLETELLCQSRDKQRQTVQFWVPTSWWQHLKQTILRRCFGGLKPSGVDWWPCDPKVESAADLRWHWLWRWIGCHIRIRFVALNKTVEWEVLDSYPGADIAVPANLGEPVRIVIPQGEVALE